MQSVPLVLSPQEGPCPVACPQGAAAVQEGTSCTLRVPRARGRADTAGQELPGCAQPLTLSGEGCFSFFAGC